MLDDGDQTAVDTVELLRRRLEKIEIILFGKNDIDKPEETVPHGKDRAVLSRLPRLESNLTKLASKSAVVDDLLKLCKVDNTLLAPHTDVVTRYYSSRSFQAYQTGHSPRLADNV